MIYQDITTTTTCVVFSHYRIYKELFVDQSGIDLICVDPTVHIFNYLLFDQNVQYDGHQLQIVMRDNSKICVQI